MKFILLTLGVLMTMTASAGAAVVTSPTGLKYEDHKAGTGAEAVKGKTVSVHYTGWLDEKGAKGKKFDSSRDRGVPIEFALGLGKVIPGWEEGIAGMKVGGTRTLLIPSKLGYGARGAGGAIPPNADLIFDVELVGVK
jgi:peptidylprolyl isomerase